MKNQTNTNLLIRSSLALALGLALGSSVYAQTTKAAPGKSMMDSKMAEHCQEMKEQKQKMQADINAQNAELTEHVAQMNSAPDAKKMNLMAALVTQMVEQRIAMDARKAKIEEAMMQHMMEHMQMGKDSMAQCPMMKGMDDTQGMKGMGKKQP